MTKINQNLIEAGQLAAKIHHEVAEMTNPGVNLLQIEQLIARLITSSGFNAAFLGYKNYPAASCLSVNSDVVHAIPQDYVLKIGDVLAVDFGVAKNGSIVDTARTYSIGKVSSEAAKLIKVTERALKEAIRLARAGGRVGDIGHCIQKIVETNGFFIIKDLTGHGVGRELQVPPSIPNFGRSGKGAEIKEGMVLAIEPITALKPVDIRLEKDRWTVRAHPDVICAHFEDTIFVTDGDPIILT